MEYSILKILFGISTAVVVFVYVCYPILILLLARWLPQVSKQAWLERDAVPKVSMIISAFNEEAVIEPKLLNTLQLSYPPGRLEVVVVSDCSNDGTDNIVRRFSHLGVRLLRQPERRGKSAGLNAAVPLTRGEIIVFSDANALYKSDSIKHLVKHFADPHVGYVVGNARYTQAGGRHPSAESEGLYWRFESWLKRKESRFASVVGGDGAIYAIRKELFTPLRPTDINDLLNPLQIIVRGYRGIYAAEAISYEDAADSFEKEFRRKVRIVSRSLNAVRREIRILLPWVQFRHWICLLAHKLLRWFVPVFLLVALASSTLLWQYLFYRIATTVQLFFYALALAAWIGGSRARAAKLFYLSYYFCLVNLASLVGIAKFLTGSLQPIWETVRQKQRPSHEPV